MKKGNMVLLCLVTIIIAFSINVSATECSEVFETGEGSLIYDLNEYVFKPIKWLTPTLLIVLTSFDFAKVVFSGDGKGMDKAKSNFLKRCVAALIIFFAPNIINLIVELVHEQSIASCTGQF